ncbi:holo-ACP synthase [bacterium]|nr:holo-ACP synthase [bacterium]
MIVACGISLISNDKIKQAEQKFGEKFLNYLFTKEELAYSCPKKILYQRLGARFAAKCAVFQALGWNKWRAYKSIKIVKNNLGAPGVCVAGKIKQYIIDNDYKRINLSVSHIEDYSIAQVVVEK